MTKRLGLFAVSAAALMLAPPLMAQESTDGTLHVVRPNVNAEQDRAELCLEFDHALDLSDRARVISGVKLTHDGKTVPLAAGNINLASSSLCLQSLEHREKYGITIAGLRGEKGEKLTEAYRLSFTVPDRQPSLAFAGDQGSEDLARLRDNDPILHAVNVTGAKASLYHVTDPARMAEAFSQRMQTTLAPSESVTYARTHGQSVWESKIPLAEADDDKTANRTVEKPVPLHALTEAKAAGFYLLVAADENPPPKSTDSNDIAPLAAQWFLRSDLRAHAFFKQDGIVVQAENSGGTTIVADARVLAFDRDFAALGEAKTDAAGQATLSMPREKLDAATIIVAVTAAGDVDFIDAAEARAESSRFTLPGLDAAMAADHPFYAPAAKGYLVFAPRDIHGDTVTASGSRVELMRPDHSPYGGLQVPDSKDNLFYMDFTVPPQPGLWKAVWRQADGQQLASASFRVTPNPEAPQTALTADRPTLDYDGAVDLHMKSTLANGTPASFIAGRVMVQWKEPDTLAGFDGYRFGENEKTIGSPEPVAAFITDANGTASLHLTLKPPDDRIPLHSAVITIRPDATSGALEPEPLILSVRPNNLVIGIRSSASNGKFAENSLARFDIIALDGNGKRHEDTDLKYQIYEEGRSFAWFQDDGRWKYKPRPQHRRIGGGPLNIKSNGTSIHWPVTAGAYLLEITDTDGRALAQYQFDAGWGFLKTDPEKEDTLELQSDKAPAIPGKPVTVRFTLEKPEVIRAVVADDRIRSILHEARKEGDNTITFTPTDEWGRHIRVRIETDSAAGTLEKDIIHQPKEIRLSFEAPPRNPGGQELSFTVKTDPPEQTSLSILATPKPDEQRQGLSSILVQNIKTDNAGRAVVRFAVPRFTGSLAVNVAAWNKGRSGRQTFTVAVGPSVETNADIPDSLRIGDDVDLILDLKNIDAPAGSYRALAGAQPAIRLSGQTDSKTKLKEGESSTVPLGFTALEEGSHEITLDIFGPRDLRLNRNWIVTALAANQSLKDLTYSEIAAQKTWSLPPKAKTKTKDLDQVHFIAPRSLYKTPALLTSFLDQAPLTTGELAGWLEAARLWRDTLASAGLAPTPFMQMRMDQRMKKLLARQNADGSFPKFSESNGDASATADALMAIAHGGVLVPPPASDGAIRWLQQQLSNTWFDESERAVRAAEFAALAAVDRLDVAAVRYFAETSNGKTLPPRAMAQLAAALAKSNDRDKAYQWLTAVRDRLAEDPMLLPSVAENPLVDVRDLDAALNKVADDMAQHPARNPEAVAAFLRAVWIVNARAGNWRVAINETERQQTGILGLSPTGKNLPPTIRNPAGQPLYLATADVSHNPSGDAGLSRRFYTVAGASIAPDQLKEGDVYIVLLEGRVPAGVDETHPLIVHDNAGVAVEVLSCLLDKDTGGDSWAWLRAQTLSPVSFCEAGPGGVTAALENSDEEKDSVWHAAYLAKIRYAGSFALPFSSAHIEGGESIVSGAMRIQSH